MIPPPIDAALPYQYYDSANLIVTHSGCICETFRLAPYIRIQRIAMKATHLMTFVAFPEQFPEKISKEIEMIRNTALLMLMVFTFSLFAPGFMQPKKAEADMVDSFVVGITLYVTIKGIECAYGYVRNKIKEHKTGDDHPDNHPLGPDEDICGGDGCTTVVTSTSHHVAICGECEDNQMRPYYTCEGSKCSTCRENNSSSNNYSWNYYYNEWW